MKHKQRHSAKALPAATRAEIFADHVKEFRQRLTVTALAFLAGGAAGYAINRQVTLFLVKPLHQTLYYNTPGGGFSFIMKICTMFGIVVCLPVAIYNVISFIQPAFSKSFGKPAIRVVTVLSFLLAIGGAAFAYYEVLPASFRFFGGFSANGLHALITAPEYLKFVTNAILTFAVLFQVPLLVLFINRIKPIPPRTMLKYEKYVVIGSLAIAVVLPFSYDPIMQFMVAVPIIALYNVSLVAVWAVNRRHNRKRKLYPANYEPVHRAAPRRVAQPVRPVPVSSQQREAPTPRPAFARQLRPDIVPPKVALPIAKAPKPSAPTVAIPEPKPLSSSPRYGYGFEFTPSRPMRSYITLPRSEY